MTRLRPFLPYQYPMFRYCMKQRHPILFVEQRLGKCIVTIRRCKMYKPKGKKLKILIVGPNSTIESWCSELEKEQERDKIVLEGPKRREKLQEDYVWYMINPRSAVLTPELEYAWDWDAVIIDESFLRNPNTDTSKYFLKRFRLVRHRWLLSGTPNPEDDLEYWAQVAWCDGEAFGFRNFWDYRIKNYYLDGYDWTPNPGVKDRMKASLAGRCFFLSKKDAGIKLNDSKEVVYLELPPDIQALYDKAEEFFELGDKTTIWETAKYVWLRQLCGGFSSEDFVWDGKLQRLLQIMLDERDSEPLVVYFNFNPEIETVAAYLDDFGIPYVKITGELSRSKREEHRRSWMEGSCRIILVQQAIAQTGMDLSRANTVIYYSQHPGALSNEQSKERIVKVTKKEELKFIYLVVRGTVDEDVYTTLTCKKMAAALTTHSILKRQIEERQRVKKCLIRRSGPGRHGLGFLSSSSS